MFEKIGGCDVSFLNNINALAIVVILDKNLTLLYKETLEFELSCDYVAGFLAKREAPPIIKILESIKIKHPEMFPQVLLVDGCGLLHPNKFGLACTIGNHIDIPTIGVAKNFLEIRVDDLLINDVKRKSKILEKRGDEFELIGKSGFVYGSALLTSDSCSNPIFVSIGHKISLSDAIQVVLECCKFRIPEPIRFADQISRSIVRSKEQSRN